MITALLDHVACSAANQGVTRPGGAY
ncbi:hypothetical protein BOS5A_10324 [Bosea sp. EC-HK365B]|nr:hypothetical protein BOSE21B_10746 [Bosea sp. 21B]CAD5263786.1 hypothetical protein BOSE7B_150389 [Bosea sp. 7B]VVT44035.1 hypothetical protein BOS5A_10324 [Bosea sp. EC-HK365B]VXB14434.1 hypothetical protein BOSE29B_10524 [Bosea sp. 29B]VXC40545.1 hypothetical protein BOSE127_190015 [Bosea sp. 127]